MVGFPFFTKGTNISNVSAAYSGVNHIKKPSIYCLKEVLHLLPKTSMFCALSQNNQQHFDK